MFTIRSRFWICLRYLFSPTGVLVPLFGLHNVLAAYKPNDASTWRIVIEIISAVTISFQVTLLSPLLIS